MARVGERGSIISFIVVGVVLVGLVAGGIYLAKHTLSPLAQQAGTEVAVTNPDDSPSTNGGDQEPQDKTQAEKDQAAKQAAEAEKKAQAEREAQQAKEAKEREQREQEEQQASSDTDDEEAAASEESTSESDYTLPQTGPAEIVGTGFILAVVTGSAIAYRRSTQVL